METFSGHSSPIATQATADGNGSWQENRSGGSGEGVVSSTAQPFEHGDNPFGSSAGLNIRHSPGLDSTLNFPPLAAGETLYFSFNYKALDGDAVSHSISFFTEDPTYTPFMNLSFTQNAGDGTKKDLTLKAQNETQTLEAAVAEDSAYFVYGKLEASTDLRSWTLSANITADVSSIPENETWTLSRQKTYPSARSGHANRLSFDTGGSGTGRYLVDDIRLGRSYGDVVNLAPEDRSGQIVILKMDDLRQHVAGTGVKQTWIDVLAKLRAANAVTNIGIVAMYINGDGNGTNVVGAANDLANGGQEWIDWVKAQHAAGDVEFWQHGWDHLPALDEDPSGNTSEFQARVARQQRHWNWAQAAGKAVLGFDFRSFGAPGNKVNADTIILMNATPEINARYYGDDQSLISTAFNIERFGGSIESGSGGNFAPDWDVYQAAQAAHGDKAYLCFQMHPELWQNPEENLAVFQQILDDLVAKKVTFMTAQQFVKHIAQRRDSLGPVINFNTWGDFSYLFKEGGQVNKYSETAGAGLKGSRGLVVGSGGVQSSLVLQRSLPGNIPQVELALHFQHAAPSSSGAQPLFLGLGPEDRYNPNLSNGGPENDHILVALDLNGAPSASQPRLRISSSADGILTQNLSSYLSSPLVAGNWYRLRAVITHDLNGYDMEAFIEESDNSGAIGAELLTHSASDRKVPDLASISVFPFFGGQGSADDRGIGALDNFRVSALRPVGADDGLLAWEGVRNPQYRSNHSAYSGSSPQTRGFAATPWASAYSATVRPAGWDGAANADGESRGLGYTASGGESLLSAFSYRKLETARSVRELDPDAFAAFLEEGEIGIDGSTLYLSVLLQPRLNDPDGQVSFELLSNGNASGNRVFGIGIDRSLDDSIRVARNGDYAAALGTLGQAVALQTEFLVVKIEFGAGITSGNERISIWRNPAWLSEESMSAPDSILPDVADFHFDRIGFWNLNGAVAWFDEFRIGSRWEAVAPVQRDRKSHVYKHSDQRDLKLWVWNPANASPSDRRPAMLLLHGGGWAGGDPSKLETQALHFLDQGYVCIGVEYRLTSEAGVTADLSVQDSRSAMRYLKAHAHSFGIDPERIVALGGSAGGHLSLGLSMFGAGALNDPADDATVNPRPAATIALNPVTDTSAPDGFGTASFSSEAIALLASPVDQVLADLPPLILLHGDADTSVPVADARALRDAMTTAGNAVTYHEYPGAGHGFFNIENSSDQYNTDTLIQIDAFLENLGRFRVEPEPPGGVGSLEIDEEAEANLLSWLPADGADGYRILRSSNPYSGFHEIAVLDGEATQFEDKGLTPGIRYTYRVLAFNALGDSARTERASGLALTHLEDFRMDYFGSIENSGHAADSADLEADGIPNLLEFALGGNPTLDDAESLHTRVRGTEENGTPYLELTLRRREGNGSGDLGSGYVLQGLRYRVQQRSDLLSGSWTDQAASVDIVDGPHSLGNGYEELRVRLLSTPADGAVFARVEVLAE